MVNPWPWPGRSSVGFTLNFSRQQQTEECIPRHPQQFSAGISSRQGAHTRLAQPNEADNDIGKTSSAWILLHYLSIHELG